MDFVALNACKVQPPFVPAVSSSMDTSQFDAEFTSMPLVSPSSLRDGGAGTLSQSASVAARNFEGFTFVAPHAVHHGGVGAGVRLTGANSALSQQAFTLAQQVQGGTAAAAAANWHLSNRDAAASGAPHHPPLSRGLEQIGEDRDEDMV